MIKRGEIYMANLAPTEGHETRGRRPVLVISADLFNQKTDSALVAPITNRGLFARRVGFAVELQGTQTAGIVRCDQVRAVDLDARRPRFIESVSPSTLAHVLAKVRTILA
ncbi:type II toxin-antitoxin system PemK/MazF family toxin [Cephaloticoccus primus]|uniref:type II toxin-antitoxin system PemK/MazF family toxin n=1 Tax=Cephaloticoccus primus TaxID=1548207 RepID=UPI001E4E41F3|nr:type II toxin-antitoxin system PemK/MazF family toxin [Cephaloticoccus primus]